MGAVNDVVNRLRTAFRQDKERGGDLLAKGAMSPVYPDSGYDLLQAYGYDALSDYLRLEQDLLSRFVDYEEMDDYPEISAAVDIYADDSSQPDTAIKRTVWVTSPDRTVENMLDDLFHKQLRMDEETWEIARSLCVAEGSRVWTSRGPVAIEEVSPGDWVQGYAAGEAALFRVVRRMDNGERDVYRVRTRHREILVTADHPILVRRGGELLWVKAGDVQLRRFPSGSIDPTGTDKLVCSTAWPEPPEVPSWQELGVAVRDTGGKGSPQALVLPEKMEPWLCRLLGYMWGNGFLGSEADDSTSTSVCYSRGEYPEINACCDAALARLGLRYSVNAQAGATVTCSIAWKEVLIALGWVNGATKKRVPGWLGRLPREHRKAFLDGFMDADGWEPNLRTWKVQARAFEVANVPFARDLKALVDGLGFRSGRIKCRKRAPGFKIKGRVVKTTAETGTLHYSEHLYDTSFVEENVLAVSKYGSTRVYDLEVDHEAHNFVVEGAVVHNCKYGNDFEEMLINENGVVGLNFLPAPTMRRVEGPRGELYGFVQDFKGRFGYSPQEFQAILARRADAIRSLATSPTGGTQGNLDKASALEPWEVVHFRLRGKQRRNIYGFSVLEASRWIWKRLLLLEDAAMIYRLQRAPERFAFYVDVGDLPPAEALAFVNKVRQQHKKKKFVNPSTGKMDLKFDPVSQDDDFYVPVRKGVEGTRIEVLGGPAWQHMDDVAYFQNKLFASMKVPKAYLAQDESAARAVLSSEDVRFARSVLRVQRELRNGFKKIGRTHLAALNIDPSKVEFEMNMTVPSAIFELAQLEVRNSRADLAARMREHVSLHWVLSNVYQLNDDDIEKVIEERGEDVRREGKVNAEVERMNALAQKTEAFGPPPQGIKLLESRLAGLPPSARKKITEQELFARGNRESEKRATEKLDKLLAMNGKTARQVNELSGLLRDVASSKPPRK